MARESISSIKDAFGKIVRPGDEVLFIAGGNSGDSRFKIGTVTSMTCDPEARIGNQYRIRVQYEPENEYERGESYMRFPHRLARRPV